VIGVADWRTGPAPSLVLPAPGASRGCSGSWADVSEMGRFASSPNAVAALQSASYLLWVLSGRKYGGMCEASEVYVCSDGGCGSVGCMAQSLELSSNNVVTFNAFARDQNFRHQLLFLRNRPVRRLVALMDRDGFPLDVAEFAVYDRASVGPVDISVGGGSCWDPCGTEVVYVWGVPPPAIGKLAALAFADQFVKAVECPGECTLPERITSVSRQGVSFQVFDPQDFIDNGRTGIYAVDVFLKTVNPDRAQKRARVFSPDVPQGRRRSMGGGW